MIVDAVISSSECRPGSANTCLGFPARCSGGVWLVSGWLVSNVPSWLLLLGLNVLIAGGAVLALIYVRHRFPGLRGDERSEVTQFAFMLVGFVYAFFTGFIVTAMWGQNNAADDDMRVEGATAVQMASDLTVFDKADSDRIRGALLDYERAAVTEWPLVAHGHTYPAAGQALQRLRTAYDQVQPRTDTQKTFLATSFDSLHKSVRHVPNGRSGPAPTTACPGRCGQSSS